MARSDVEERMDHYISTYLQANRAARIYYELCEQQGKQPVVDHMTLRCTSVAERAKEFLALGYTFSEKVDYLDQGWWANVYRLEGFPAIFVDQDYPDYPNGIIAPWVKTFGENSLHHIAVLVEDIEAAKLALEQAGVKFSAGIVGKRGSRLRQIFTAAEVKLDRPFSVLELAERGIDTATGKRYQGFINEQADQLMKDSLKT